MTARALLLGGVDPSGGAGITVDATVVALHHVTPLPVAVALTEQNRRRFVRCEPVPSERWRRALHVVLDDGGVDVVKIGLVGDAVTLRGIARELESLRGTVPIVVDPVLSATAGGLVPPPELVDVYRERMLPLASLLLPNRPELAVLCGGDPRRALATGAGAVLQKGGHGDGASAEDVLWQGSGRVAFRRERLGCGPVRGTGCALAAAIASLLACGVQLPEACRRGGDWLAALLRALGPAPAEGLPRALPFGRAPHVEAR